MEKYPQILTEDERLIIEALDILKNIEMYEGICEFPSAAKT